MKPICKTTSNLIYQTSTHTGPTDRYLMVTQLQVALLFLFTHPSHTKKKSVKPHQSKIQQSSISTTTIKPKFLHYTKDPWPLWIPWTLTLYCHRRPMHNRRWPNTSHGIAILKTRPILPYEPKRLYHSNTNHENPLSRPSKPPPWCSVYHHIEENSSPLPNPKSK